MMHMTFYWSKDVTILIDSWRTTSWTSYSLTLIACLIVSAFYQYLEDLRVRLKTASSSAAKTSSPAPIQTPLLGAKLDGAGGRFSAARLGGAVLFGVNAAIGYLLMLAVMSFNGGVFVAIVVGLAIGYLAFRSGDDDVAATVPEGRRKRKVFGGNPAIGYLLVPVTVAFSGRGELVAVVLALTGWISAWCLGRK
ncbi:hypothetical protein L3X38_007016 [Prunus dulcis]|uniref:Copper transport protein n=1 Tax=Prunus dulcis TaxID=3755 RepID=A0AAD5F5I7_PRUDU|nr:hypothetical protein L3X38_007016 [Prunus dulcis]